MFWLKENAEFLNILECTGQAGDAVLDTYAPLYDRIDQTIATYPQYYRFLLSLCLDLEDLGMPGSKGVALTDWVTAQGLAEAELSDLQRAEALRLLARRGDAPSDNALSDRLQRFAARTTTFSVPNRKAAYELTHIVFYLSEYGRVVPDLDPNIYRSLSFVGLMAYLDQDFDLLAEICIAQRYAGVQPNAIWESAVLSALEQTDAIECSQPAETHHDGYHGYLVCSWLAGATAEKTLPLMLNGGPARINLPEPAARPLRNMSFAIEDGTLLSDWESARAGLMSDLDEDGQFLLHEAERLSLIHI